MIVLGIDPGSRATGYGVIRSAGSRVIPVAHGAIQLPSGKKELSIAKRLHTIHGRLEEIIRTHSPDIVVVESLFYAANVKSALTLGHVRGVVLLAAAEAAVEVVEFSPLEVKKAVVGYGRADKGQVQQMVKHLLNLTELPEPHDAADALAIALCHIFNGGAPRRRARRWRAYEVPGRSK